MWKVCITEDEAVEISHHLKTYVKTLPVCDKSRDEVLDAITRLDDLINVVRAENKIVEDYLRDIRESEFEIC